MLAAIAFVAILAIGLLVADRYLRINLFMLREGFQVAGQPQRCGTDLAPCPHPLKCMNSFCGSQETAQLKDRNPLPVTP